MNRADLIVYLRDVGDLWRDLGGDSLLLAADAIEQGDALAEQQAAEYRRRLNKAKEATAEAVLTALNEERRAIAASLRGAANEPPHPKCRNPAVRLVALLDAARYVEDRRVTAGPCERTEPSPIEREAERIAVAMKERDAERAAAAEYIRGMARAARNPRHGRNPNALELARGDGLDAAAGAIEQGRHAERPDTFEADGMTFAVDWGPSPITIMAADAVKPGRVVPIENATVIYGDALAEKTAVLDYIASKINDIEAGGVVSSASLDALRDLAAELRRGDHHRKEG